MKKENITEGADQIERPSIAEAHGSDIHWITIREAVELTGRRKSTIHQWIKADILPSKKLERQMMVSKADAERLHQTQRTFSRRDHNQKKPQTSIPLPIGSSLSLNDSVPGVAINSPPSEEEASLPPEDVIPSDPACSTAPPPEEKATLAVIAFDSDTQIRCQIDSSVVAEYSQMMKQGKKFPPVILFRDQGTLYIGDGWHRLCAAQKNGYVHFPALIYGGGKAAAMRYALRANVSHGLRLTSADKRRKVQLALNMYPSISSNEIANICGVSEFLVRSIRETFEKNEPAKRIGADGKQYPAKKCSHSGSDVNEKHLFKKMARLVKKLNPDALQRLKEVIEKALQSVEYSLSSGESEGTAPVSSLIPKGS